jgi:hypothetical protein
MNKPYRLLDPGFVYTPSHASTPERLHARMKEWREQAKQKRKEDEEGHAAEKESRMR